MAALTADKIFQIFNPDARRAGIAAVTATTGDVVLTEEQALKGVINISGSAGTTGTLTWPLLGTAQKGMRWMIYNNSTTAVTCRAYTDAANDATISTGVAIGSSGTGKRAQEIMWNGTDFVETTSEFTIP